MFSARRTKFHTTTINCYIEINITSEGWIRYETCNNVVVDTYRTVGLFLVQDCVLEVRDAIPLATLANYTIGAWITTCPS